MRKSTMNKVIARIRRKSLGRNSSRHKNSRLKKLHEKFDTGLSEIYLNIVSTMAIILDS